MDQNNNSRGDDQNNNQRHNGPAPDGAIKNPQNWKSGDDPATPSQLSYLSTLAEQADDEPPTAEMTKAEASLEIDRLRSETGISDK